MKISDIIRLREEVIRGEISGWIDLRGLSENRREADAEYVFSITYPITEIKDLIAALNQRIRGERRHGFFEILGGYGTGKSHVLLLIYHLFKNPDKGKEWLRRNGLTLELPRNPSVLAIHLMDRPPEYLWEPVFKGLGREDLLQEVKAYPGAHLLKEALKDKTLVVLIIDELESWYRSARDKDANLNFLQVLSEVSCEEDSNLIVFCALYGEVPEITARIDRVGPYCLNLTLSRDRPKVVLFRLIGDVLDDEAVSKVVKGYVRHYRRSELEVPELSRYRKRMIEYYPVHPELMDTLLSRYSSSPNYQNTRGVLYLLSSVLRNAYEKTDLLLSSDVDMDEDDLLPLGRVLVENAKRDAESIGDPLIRKMLNVILLYSFGEEGKIGASRDDVILGVLRPGMNVNDLDVALVNLPSMAPHVWLRDSRYVIGSEANMVALIQKMALNNIRQGKIDGALAVVKKKLKRDRFHYVYHPNPDIGDHIDDDEVAKVVVALKSLDENELLKLYEGRQYPNMLILYVPRPEAGDLSRDEDVLVIADRIRLCSEHMRDASGENRRLLMELKGRDDRNLAGKLSDAYGFWVKVTEFKPRRVSYRLVPCSLEDVRAAVRKQYDVETVKSEILSYLKEKRSGVNIESLLYDFKTTPGRPVILYDRTLREAVERLEREGSIVVSGKTLWLREYSRPSEVERVRIPGEKLTEVKEAEPIREGKPEAKEEVPIRPRLKLVETRELSTLYNLSVELERRTSEVSKINNMRLIFKDMKFENIQKFLEFLKGLQVEEGRLESVGLELNIEKSMDRKELISLVNQMIDKVVVPKGSSVKAIVEGE